MQGIKRRILVALSCVLFGFSLSAHGASITGPSEVSNNSSFQLSWNVPCTSFQNALALTRNGVQIIAPTTSCPQVSPTQTIANGSFSYVVQLCNYDGGSSQWICQAASGSHTVFAGAPNAPTSLTVPTSTVTAGSVDVQWGAAAGATSYVVERAANGGSFNSATPVFSGTGLSTSIPEPNGSYQYRVKSKNGNGNGDSSYVVSSSVQVLLVPDMPSAITVPTTTVSTSSVTVSWATVTGAPEYELQQSSDGGATWFNITGPGTSFANYTGNSRIVTLNSNGNYKFRVRAVNNSGASLYKESSSFTVLFPPTPPTGLTVPSGVNLTGSYTVTWNAVATATSYLLQEYIDGVANGAAVNMGTATLKSYSGKSNGAYSYSVTASNASGSSSATGSSTFDVVIPPMFSGDMSSTHYSYATRVDANGNVDILITAKPDIILIASDIVIPIPVESDRLDYLVLANGAVVVNPDPGLTSGFGSSAHIAHFGDFNGDGNTDVLLQSTSSAVPSVLLNGTTNVLLISAVYNNGDNGIDYSSDLATLTIEDIDGDGTDEFKLVQSGGSVFYVNQAGIISQSLVAESTWAATGGAIFDAAVTGAAVPTGDTGSNSVGALNGSGGVSGGQGSYSIPIVVPPGRKGMQPSVSLGYSSSGGNGLVGVGWGLSAGSAISRCAATAAQDGYNSSVQYSATRDRLCLDGQRLMVVTGTYGASGSTYRTELDSFARITQTGAINGTTTSFTVEYKNGLVSSFGDSNDSRHSANGRTETMSWAITETQDRSGNTITYDYAEYGDGEHLLETINYTGYNGSDGNRHVRFEYEDRLDPRTSYMAGGKTQSTQRLLRIKTQYTTTDIRHYNMNYGALSLSSNRTLLRSVQECAHAGVTPHCLPSTNFDWQEQTQQFVTEKLQFENSAGSQVNVHADKRWLHQVLPHSDVNGDGVRDWDGYFVNAEGEITGPNTVDLANCYQARNSLRTLTCLEPDLNADGITDEVRKNNYMLELRLSGSTSWITTDIPWTSFPTIADLDDKPISFADFNADGWPDLAMRRNAELVIYFHTKSLTAPYLSSNSQSIANFTYNNTQNSSYATNDIQPYGDMDGNGTPDFVVSTFATGSQTPGLPRPQEIVLTHPQASGGMTTTTRSITGLYGLHLDINAHFFHDVNGDGLTDLIGMSPTANYRINNGTDFDATWKPLGITIPTTTYTYDVSNGNEPNIESYTYPIMSKVMVMDYNGDGRDDILIADGVVASGCSQVLTSTGNLWPCDEEHYDTYWTKESNNVGTTINSTIKDNSVRTYKAQILNENAAGDITVSQVSTGIVASAAQTAVIDATGNGLPDVITVLGCRLSACEFNTETSARAGTVQNSTYTAGAWINRNIGAAETTGPNASRYEAHDMMKRVTNGLGVVNEWTYRPLSSDEYATANSEFYDTTHSYQATDTDYFHFASSMYVVAEHKASNGLGTLNSTKYRYRGAIYNNKGRGFQGFKSIIVEQNINAASDIISRTDFHQKWPLSSIMEQACSWLKSDNVADDNPGCTSVTSMATVDDIHNVATSGGARFVAVKEQTDKSFDLSTRTLLTTDSSITTFDSYGNATNVTKTHLDDYTGLTASTVTNYAAPDLTNWWLNKVNNTVSTHNPVSSRHASSPAIVSGSDNAKITTTTIEVYDVAQRLPTVVKAEGNDSNLFTRVTTAYNSYGLPTTVTTAGSGILVGRSTSTNYTSNGVSIAADGYFPLTVTNAKGHTMTTEIDPGLGVAIAQTDPNGLESLMDYDAFGRAVDTLPSGQLPSSVRYFWCDTGTSCPTGAVFRMSTYQEGSPDTHAYIDSLGRTIRTSIRNFADTDFINSDVTFDARGLATFESQPYDPSKNELSTLGTTYTGYDALGRLTAKHQDQANGTQLNVSYTYNGLKTDINAGGKLMHRISNGLGQLMETKDAKNGLTKYAYDSKGNPIVLQDPNGNNITASFIALGFKSSVADPNMGNKSFTYNGLGEVLTETDANSDVISYEYDALGRVVIRKVNGVENGHWYFDEDNDSKGLGLLDYEDSNIQADGTRLRKFYEYSAPSTGRKVPVKVIYQVTDGIEVDLYQVDNFYDSNYGRPNGVQYPGGIRIAFDYNDQGHLIREKNASSGYVYREITELSSRGQVTAATVSNGLINETASYYEATGQMETNQATMSGGTFVHNLSYGYDDFGNLNSQQTNAGFESATEAFVYDDLHRLTKSTRTLTSGTSIIDYTYDASGNLLEKSDYASTYHYQGTKPNAVSSVTLAGGGTATFGYDNNGNMTSGDGKTLTYNAHNKPLTITKGSNSSTFSYGADLMRYMQKKSSGQKTVYLDKLMEVVTEGSKTKYIHYLSDLGVLTKTEETGLDDEFSLNFLHKDRLGSTITITNDNGLVQQTRGFDAFGKPRDGDWEDRYPGLLDSTITTRGFTSHEHLDDFELIHMNGRAYDYNLGRFLSVDPFIQSPGNSQSLNPYSYIMNNPLGGVDPSGYESEPNKEAQVQVSVKNERSRKVARAGSHIKRTQTSADFVFTVTDAEGNVTVTSFSVDYNGAVTGSEVSVGKNGEVSGSTFSGDLNSVKPNRGSGFGNGGLAGQSVNENSRCKGSCHGYDTRDKVYANDEQLQPLYITAIVLASLAVTAAVPEFVATLGGFSLFANEGGEGPVVAGRVAKNVDVSRARYGDAAEHIADAQKAGHPDVLTIARDGAKPNRKASIGGLPKVPGKQLDEYPPAMFKEGGAGASVRAISPKNNMGAGACIGNACRGLSNGDKVRIRVVD